MQCRCIVNLHDIITSSGKADQPRGRDSGIRAHANAAMPANILCSAKRYFPRLVPLSPSGGVEYWSASSLSARLRRPTWALASSM